ncbi:MAG: murein biosynthesis integral membrane protein MurJ [Deltaproteobacteria bacterium]|nr:murein biosynthesis integral membrane protein MurJ [Deltaproteobacteria bacterium]
MSEKGSIFRATGIMGAATTLSRVTGLARDMVIARLFGAGFASDAFFIAYTIPNLFRRFFAEGSLTAAFVPSFSEIYHLRGREEARRFANRCWTLLLLVMTAVTVAGVLASPLLVRLFGGGFAAVAGKLEMTDLLNRLMFPYLFFVSLLALVTGILNVLGRFFLPSLAPLFLNLCMIASAWFLRPWFDPPILALGVGVLIGGGVQLLLQFPVLKGLGFVPRLVRNCWNAEVRKAALLMLPGIAGVAVYQINLTISRLMASFLPEGSVSYLYYAQRLFEFPQGIFIVSLAQAVLPSMSRQAALGSLGELKDSLRFSLLLIVFVTLPAAAGLTVCAVPVFSLFFMNENFDLADVRYAAQALIAYAPGLLFVGVSRILAPVFYALKDTRTPVRISFWTLLVNGGCGLIFMGQWGHVGLAAAASLAAAFNSLLLWRALRIKIGSLGLAAILKESGMLVPVSLLMTLGVAFVLRFGSWETIGGGGGKLLILAAAVGSGMVLFAVGCWLFRVPQARELLGLIGARIFRKGSS